MRDAGVSGARTWGAAFPEMGRPVRRQVGVACGRWRGPVHECEGGRQDDGVAGKAGIMGRRQMMGGMPDIEERGTGASCASAGRSRTPSNPSRLVSNF